ncbi:co-chaperone GroES [Taylorella equigenitalis]|uniref:Co-chaperonin GroES n=3 Tax=Taylorella equigenitalis TaxID=29575 RepID=A0A654KHJ4_TAYEM|nr:co-chaperone GroES [Taylorella equigenitalis]ADU91904.1 Heat shock protein 60 family co-chaperone GroES [Taylorella equigenitalis MCE9]AFN35468.1 putative chaperonin [Taylorella equigenitalis ATCC 35865]ASY30122.1 co-chaperone GroES [Taylorella equigenitalis]ASY37428.1 co-chaperone GroES [Taylorella equigenitalis]ASY38897.1 co-chaperone GroES [Taylorella equigenitalis]
MALRPLQNLVVIKRVDNKKTTESGIILAGSAEEKQDIGEVVAVGPGRKSESGQLISVDLKVGDRVLFGKYAGQAVKMDGEELLVIRDEEILAVVE